MTLGSATNLDNVTDGKITKERHQEKKKDGNMFKERKQGIWWIGYTGKEIKVLLLFFVLVSY